MTWTELVSGKKNVPQKLPPDTFEEPQGRSGSTEGVSGSQESTNQIKSNSISQKARATNIIDKRLEPASIIRLAVISLERYGIIMAANMQPAPNRTFF